MRAFFLAPLMALIVGVPATDAAAHDGWFVRVCPAKTEADRINLVFSGGRQGFNWSWTKGRSPDEIDLPLRFHSVATLTMRGSTVSTPLLRLPRRTFHGARTATSVARAMLASCERNMSVRSS